MYPKDYSAKELGPNGMSCFIVKINSSLDLGISRKQKSVLDVLQTGWLNEHKGATFGFFTG